MALSGLVVSRDVTIVFVSERHWWEKSSTIAWSMTPDDTWMIKDSSAMWTARYNRTISCRQRTIQLLAISSLSTSSAVHYIRTECGKRAVQLTVLYPPTVRILCAVCERDCVEVILQTRRFCYLWACNRGSPRAFGVLCLSSVISLATYGIATIGCKLLLFVKYG